MNNKALSVIFQNEHFIILDKPSGVLSTPARDAKDSRFVLGRELEVQLARQVYPVHRLDFEVSGIIMYALNAEAHKVANLWFENRKVHKTYRAYTKSSQLSELQNLTPGSEFEWHCLLLRGKKRTYESPVGKKSLTLARLIEINGKGYLGWDLKPVTGRSHQLRYEMYRHGMPILGDTLYGSDLHLSENQIALRAYRIEFDLDVQGQLKKWGLSSVYEISPQIIIP